MKIDNKINKFILRNTIVVFAALAILIVVVIYSIITNNALLSQKNNYYIMSQEGQFISLEQVKKDEVRAIEILHHLSMFIDNYYNINQNNWEIKVNKALWLGDLKLDFQNRDNTGYYANIIQWGVERNAELKQDDVELVLNPKECAFKIILPLTETFTDKITSKKSIKNYLYFLQGTIREIEPNFPFNPHGLYIENFREEKKIELAE